MLWYIVLTSKAQSLDTAFSEAMATKALFSIAFQGPPTSLGRQGISAILPPLASANQEPFVCTDPDL